MTTELIQTLKTLADETRLNLVKLLLTHDLCVGALAKRLAVSEAAVSQHLKQLREAGLVKGEKAGILDPLHGRKGEALRTGRTPAGSDGASVLSGGRLHQETEQPNRLL